MEYFFGFEFFFLGIFREKKGMFFLMWDFVFMVEISEVTHHSAVKSAERSRLR